MFDLRLQFWLGFRMGFGLSFGLRLGGRLWGALCRRFSSGFSLAFCFIGRGLFLGNWSCLVLFAWFGWSCSRAVAALRQRAGRVVGRRHPAVREPLAPHRDLRHPRPAHRHDPDAAPCHGDDVRPGTPRRSRRGLAPEVHGERGRADRRQPRRRPLPRRRALHPPALLPRRALGARRLAARRPVGLPARRRLRGDYG